MHILTARGRFYGQWSIVAFFSACALVFALVLFWAALKEEFVDAYQDISYAHDPTAARAFAYGEYHFDAQYPGQYDIGLAEHFFDLAAADDPTYPYVYHELARIDFLKGNLTSALAKINFQISLHGDSEPNSYYVRGLIEGYMGEYNPAAADYAHYIQFDPQDWAAMNDYSWVLLKADKFQLALEVTSRALQLFPGNPWLLNSNAIALYETGDFTHAETQAEAAVQATKSVTTAQWLTAYPGNDPTSAQEGIAALQNSAQQNMHMIQLAIGSSTAAHGEGQL